MNHSLRGKGKAECVCVILPYTKHSQKRQWKKKIHPPLSEKNGAFERLKEKTVASLTNPFALKHQNESHHYLPPPLFPLERRPRFLAFPPITKFQESPIVMLRRMGKRGKKGGGKAKKGEEGERGKSFHRQTAGISTKYFPSMTLSGQATEIDIS